jgi:hypothetical protein
MRVPGLCAPAMPSDYQSGFQGTLGNAANSIGENLNWKSLRERHGQVDGYPMMETTVVEVPTPGVPPTSSARVLAGLAAVFGAFLLLMSICGMFAYLILPIVRPGNALADNTILASGCAIGLIFGVIILVVARAIIRGRSLPPFILPSPGLFLGLFLLVIGIGQGILYAQVGAAYLFPPWHVLASLMLPLAALAYASRRLTPAPGQAVLGQLAWGGAGSVMLALVLELVVGVFLFLAAALVLAAVLGPDQLNQLVDQFRTFANGSLDVERIVAVLTRQPFVLVIAIAAALAFFTVIGPVIEESLKGLGPGIWIIRTRPSASRALLWGLAAGAGFAFSENLLLGANLVSGQGGGGGLWAALILARAGTSLVHVAATGTVSLGWYSAFAGGRRSSFLLFFIAGFGAHGSWNLLTILLSSALSAGGSFTFASGILGGIGMVIAVLAIAVFVLLVLAAALWIGWLIRWANRQDQTKMTEPI